jgi:hypothetical protein
VADGTFLLGVGCQKGGTAWLHRYLEESPQVDPGFRKEYHVWDAVDLPSGRSVRERIERQGGPRADFVRDPGAYFDYFAGLLEPPATRLTADITPAYAELSVERLASIRDGFAERGVRPVAVFLLRDPVERVWSANRMDMARLGADAPEPAEVRVGHMYHHPMYEARTRYDETMARLEATFGRDRVFYGLYEQLFSPVTLQPLSAFLGIDYHEPDVDRQVNVSPKTATLPDEVVARIARHFAPVYAATQARFPDLDLASVWPSMGML